MSLMKKTRKDGNTLKLLLGYRNSVQTSTTNPGSAILPNSVGGGKDENTEKKSDEKIKANKLLSSTNFIPSSSLRAPSK